MLAVKQYILMVVTTFMVILASVSFAVLHHDDGVREVTFNLTDQHGKVVTQNHYEGKHMLVFFGFTSCSGICPTQMMRLTRALNSLDKNGYQGQIKPVFISVDAERDTPQVIASYLEIYHGNFDGLTGSRELLKQTADSFKVYLDSPPADKEPGYQLTHSSVAYIIDPEGNMVDYIPFDLPDADIVSKIESQLNLATKF